VESINRSRLPYPIVNSCFCAPKYMSFQLDRGLFQFDFTDRHAILGVGVNAKEADIRERYQAVARVLHPDSGKWKTDADRNLAVQLFSRLVTHAYGALSRASQREEHAIMLELIGKRLIEEGNKLQIADPLCQQLYQSGNDFELVYDRLLTEIVAKQYNFLPESVEIINQISELNLVYLLRKQLQLVRSAPPSASNGAISKSGKETTSTELTKSSLLESALRRADDYMSKKNWTNAVQELREIISAEPGNARAHASLGLAYLYQQQTTMAKLSINKALQLDPKHPQAIHAKQEFDRVVNGNQTAANGKAAPKKSNEGKMFGGFFSKK
jgi:curved DNA-binding protein CbpA